jgi:hypothetical protein
MNQKQFDKVIAYAVKKGFDRPWRPDLENSFELIYEPDFAKALWGEETYYPLEGGECGVDCDYCNYKLKVYEYHLSRMVISKDPLKYLWDMTLGGEED